MKILGIVAAISLAIVMAYGTLATGAWFTDNVTTQGMRVDSGSLDLQISYQDFTSTPVLEPGGAYQTVGYFKVKNVGDYDMKWRGWITNVANDEVLKDYILVKCVMNPEGYVGNYGPAGKELFTGVKLTDLLAANSRILMDDPVWAFGPGNEAGYQILATLASNAPDSVQAKFVTGNLYIEATQRINTGWGQ